MSNEEVAKNGDKRAAADTSGSPVADGGLNNKRPKRSNDDEEPSITTTTAPCSFVTWNCNGLLPRCKYSVSELERLVQETNEPDLILLQEVRCKAAARTQRHVMCREDLNIVSPHFRSNGGVFGNYIPHWSLADKRYAGTCTLVHKRLNFTSNESNTSFSAKGAIDLLLQKHNLTRKEVGIEDVEDKKMTSPVSGNNNNKPKKKQTSIRSFFSPTTSPTAMPPHRQHNEEGRFQFLSFPGGLDIVHTYVPNNGMKNESFARRKEWDDQMLEFVRHRQRILEYTSSSSTAKVVSNPQPQQRPLLWVGDMNVARDYRDGSHWSCRHENDDDDNAIIDEWWTNEKKCLIRPNPTPARETCDMGMPSFTQAERTRFETILEQGSFTDIWRTIHPNGSHSHNHLPCQWDRPDFTWRGTLGKNGKQAKYQGKGQRLDYFLASDIDLGRVESCEILGYGEKREGLFCGSDHCASKLQLRRSTTS